MHMHECLFFNYQGLNILFYEKHEAGPSIFMFYLE